MESEYETLDKMTNLNEKDEGESTDLQKDILAC